MGPLDEDHLSSQKTVLEWGRGWKSFGALQHTGEENGYLGREDRRVQNIIAAED